MRRASACERSKGWAATNGTAGEEGEGAPGAGFAAGSADVAGLSMANGLARTNAPVARYPPLMLPAISKMGKYMAMTKPPTTVPRNTIKSGSIMLVIEATATSTSSS